MNRRTKKYIKWSEEMEYHIAPYKKVLNEIKRYHQLNDCEFHVCYELFMPNKFKKDGTINKRAGDCSNYIKSIEDFLFGKQLNIDDAYCAVTAFKTYSPDESIEVTITAL